MYRDQFGEFVFGYWGLKGSIALGMLKGHQNVFIYFLQDWTSSENCQKSSKVAWTFSEIPVLTRHKSHVFDSEKV